MSLAIEIWTTLGFLILSVPTQALCLRGVGSTRRNERLKRKKNEIGYGRKSVYNLDVTVESAEKRNSTKKLESLRKSVSAAYTVERSEATIDSTLFFN